MLLFLILLHFLLLCGTRTLGPLLLEFRPGSCSPRPVPPQEVELHLPVAHEAPPAQHQAVGVDLHQAEGRRARGALHHRLHHLVVNPHVVDGVQAPVGVAREGGHDHVAVLLEDVQQLLVVPEHAHAEAVRGRVQRLVAEDHRALPRGPRRRQLTPEPRRLYSKASFENQLVCAFFRRMWTPPPAAVRVCANCSILTPDLKMQCTFEG
mmetsp:Transcript_29077/g.50262  ORF Transcript_29077/g.50262 Transcript_29077/m.50262 type:complete len:208 (+) Transcript_29077:211-834(+)